MAVRKTTTKSTAARRVTPKASVARVAKTSLKRAHAVGKSVTATPLSRTSVLLRDIRARGKKLTAEINDLLHHLG